MDVPFYDHPILNSPYSCPTCHWELDKDGQPTQKVIEKRRRAEFITPIPKPQKRKDSKPQQGALDLDDGQNSSTAIINEIRRHVDA
jgi:type III restriction enzyme